MIKPNNVSVRSSLCRTVLLSLGCALSLVLMPVAAQAADNGTLQPLTTEKTLPLTHTFAKVAGEKGPFELKLTNTSKETVKVTVQVLLSVYSHASAKARNLPEQAIEAGKDWTIPQLAALDKVIIKAEGYTTLELEVH